jgi:hypothetical protein
MDSLHTTAVTFNPYSGFQPGAFVITVKETPSDNAGLFATAGKLAPRGD